MEEVTFACDSLLEGDGFEPSVPGTKEPVFVAEGELRDRTGAAKRVVSYAVPMVRIHLPPAESPCLTQTRPMQVENRRFRALLWLTQLRRGFGHREASVSGLWAALTSGARGGSAQPTGAGGDRALFRLIELHAYFRELGRPERRLLLALRVAAGEAAPTDDRELAELKSALRGVLALQRSGRGPRRRPPGLRSIVMTRPGSG